jgi:hypothetical protein
MVQSQPSCYSARAWSCHVAQRMVYMFAVVGESQVLEHKITDMIYFAGNVTMHKKDL